jgi:uncharacterized protein (TIGR01244 family)
MHEGAMSIVQRERVATHHDGGNSVPNRIHPTARRRLAHLALALGGAIPLAGCSTPGGSTASVTQAEAARPDALDGFMSPAADIRSGGRISADDVPRLHAAGIRHVIDLTPDDETPGFDEAGAVRAAGMRYDNLPIRGAGGLTRENVVAFDRLVDGIDEPALVHCASGNRVGALAALRAAWVDGVDDEAAVAEGRRWGLRGLEGAVREQLERERCVALAQDGEATARCAAGG